MQSIESLKYNLLIIKSLYDIIKIELINHHLYFLFISIESKIIPILSTLEIDGLNYDYNYMNGYKNIINELCNKIESKANSLLPSPILLSSNEQVSNALFNILHLSLNDGIKMKKLSSNRNILNVFIIMYYYRN